MFFSTSTASGSDAERFRGLTREKFLEQIDIVSQFLFIFFPPPLPGAEEQRLGGRGLYRRCPVLTISSWMSRSFCMYSAWTDDGSHGPRVAKALSDRAVRQADTIRKRPIFRFRRL